MVVVVVGVDVDGMVGVYDDWCLVPGAVSFLALFVVFAFSSSGGLPCVYFQNVDAFLKCYH